MHIKLGPLGTGSDGGMRWYHNSQVPKIRQHWDLGESMKGKIILRIFLDPGIEGSIHDHLAWRHAITHWFVWDPGINVHMILLWIEVDCLRERNIWEGGFVIFPFLDIVEMDRIFLWYLDSFFEGKK